MNNTARFALIAATAMLASCSTIKYNALEKVGIHKRDLLISNVETLRKTLRKSSRMRSSSSAAW